MSGIVNDDGDYVLIYDGENGLRMAPRAAAAAFEDLDAAELNVAQPEARLSTPETLPRRGVAVIGAVIVLGLVGFVVGWGWRLPARPARPAVPASTMVQPKVAMSPAPVAAVARSRPMRVAAAPPRRRVVAPAHHAPPARPSHVAVAKAATVKVRSPAEPAACATARSWAERVVCRDPELTAQDARLDQALKSAAQVGVPSGDLQQGQTAWLAQRDAAARRSRDEVATAYRQRIDEVESLANETPPF